MILYTLNELKSIYGENDIQVKKIMENDIYSNNPSFPAFKRINMEIKNVIS